MLHTSRIRIGTLLTVGLLAFGATGVAHASTPTGHARTAVQFANCTQINAVYKYGIAKPGTRYNRVNGVNRPLTGKPVFSSALYLANQRSDRDKDGIACEK
ncbi:MAG: excalibur calcium-binding domain-containing protein [Cryobacterium sp.]